MTWWQWAWAFAYASRSGWRSQCGCNHEKKAEYSINSRMITKQGRIAGVITSSKITSNNRCTCLPTHLAVAVLVMEGDVPVEMVAVGVIVGSCGQEG